MSLRLAMDALRRVKQIGMVMFGHSFVFPCVLSAYIQAINFIYFPARSVLWKGKRDDDEASYSEAKEP